MDKVIYILEKIFLCIIALVSGYYIYINPEYPVWMKWYLVGFGCPFIVSTFVYLVMDENREE